jgi:hypothetical protein
MEQGHVMRSEVTEDHRGGIVLQGDLSNAPQTQLLRTAFPLTQQSAIQYRTGGRQGQQIHPVLGILYGFGKKVSLKGGCSCQQCFTVGTQYDISAMKLCNEAEHGKAVTPEVRMLPEIFLRGIQ